jgi:hypothetical protein
MGVRVTRAKWPLSDIGTEVNEGKRLLTTVRRICSRHLSEVASMQCGWR